ncbi:MAG: iron ABC transporter permease [Dehalococcoidia bacterium]|nr:iron ABC transporter permease [Dehalococcoidia bacterium]
MHIFRSAKSEGKSNFALRLILLYAVLIVCLFLSFLVGRFPISPYTVLELFLSKLGIVTPHWESTLETVVFSVRLPRILLAIMVGGSLSVSGASYQTLFKNPMVSPDILGVSAGAGFGAALAMLHSAGWLEIQLTALVFGLIAVVLAYGISYIFARQEITIMVLAGVVVSSLFSALLSIVKTLADTTNALPSITFWLMGSLGRSSNDNVMVMLPALIFSMLLLFLFRYQINTLAAGEDEAKTMGVNVLLVKTIVVLSSTLMTVIAVSICGIIGWVGLVVPHIARMLVGANYPKLILTSFGIGGIFLLIIDNIVRGVPGMELPLGVLTALVGTPVFAVLLSRVRKGWA